MMVQNPYNGIERRYSTHRATTPDAWGVGIHTMELKGTNSTTSSIDSRRPRNPYNGIESGAHT
jgi:hypothetical protein